MNATINRTLRRRKDAPPSTPFSELPLSGANTEDETGVGSPAHSTPQPSPKSGEASAAQETGLAVDCSSPAPGADVDSNSVAASLPPETPLSADAKSDLVAAEPSKALTIPDRARLALKSEQTERDLLAMIEQSKSVTAITNAAGRQQAHAMLMGYVNARTTLDEVDEEARKELKALNQGIIEEKKRLAGLIATEEARIRGLRDAWDTEQARIKRAKAEAEQRRKDAIEARIDEIRNRAAEAMGKPSADIAALIEQTTAVTIDDTFGEFKSKAESVQKMTLDKLRYFHQSAVDSEKKAADLAEQEKRLAEERAAQRLRERRMEAINDIKGLIVVAARGRTLDAYDAAIQSLERRVPSIDEFGDLVDTATAAKFNTLEALKRDRAAIAAQQEQEAEAKRKREADEADQARKAKLRERITAIRAIGADVHKSMPEAMQDRLDKANAVVVDDSFEEFRQEAEEARSETIAAITYFLNNALEARRLEAERAEQEAARELRDKRIGGINLIRAIVGMSESLATVAELDEAISDTTALETTTEIYGDLADEATQARASTLGILNARRKLLADRLELEAATAAREIIVAPTDPVEATDGELLSPAALFTTPSTELPPEPDAPSVDDAIITTLDALAVAYSLDDVRGKELIVRMGLRVTELAA